VVVVVDVVVVVVDVVVVVVDVVVVVVDVVVVVVDVVVVVVDVVVVVVNVVVVVVNVVVDVVVDVVVVVIEHDKPSPVYPMLQVQEGFDDGCGILVQLAFGSQGIESQALFVHVPILHTPSKEHGALSGTRPKLKHFSSKQTPGSLHSGWTQRRPLV
jgi:hypothetical protein